MPKWDWLRGKKPTNTPKPPSSKAEVSKRVTQVAKLLIQWYQRIDIIPIMVKEYNISIATVDDYLKKATELIRVKNEADLEDIITIQEARILDIYQVTRREKKYDISLRAIKQHMELRGTESARKIKITPLSEEDEKKVDILLGLSIDDD